MSLFSINQIKNNIPEYNDLRPINLKGISPSAGNILYFSDKVWANPNKPIWQQLPQDLMEKTINITTKQFNLDKNVIREDNKLPPNILIKFVLASGIWNYINLGPCRMGMFIDVNNTYNYLTSLCQSNKLEYAENLCDRLALLGDILCLYYDASISQDGKHMANRARDLATKLLQIPLTTTLKFPNSIYNTKHNYQDLTQILSQRNQRKNQEPNNKNNNNYNIYEKDHTCLNETYLTLYETSINNASSANYPRYF